MVKKKKMLRVDFGAIHADNIEQLRKINTASFPIQYKESFYQDVLKRNNEHLNKFAYYNGFVVGAICARIEEVNNSDVNDNNNNNTKKTTNGKNTSSHGTTGNNGHHHHHSRQQHNNSKGGNNNGGSNNHHHHHNNAANNNKKDHQQHQQQQGQRQQPQQFRLYIMTLAVLAAYRGRGIGSQLLQSILDYCGINDDDRTTTTTTTTATTITTTGGSGGSPKNTTATMTPPSHHSIVEIALHVQISNNDAINFYTRQFGFTRGEMVENYYKRIDPPHCYRLYKSLLPDKGGFATTNNEDDQKENAASRQQRQE